MTYSCEIDVKRQYQSFSVVSAAWTSQDKPPAEIDLFLKRGAGLAELSDVPVAMQRNVTVDLKNFTLRLKGELVKRSMNYDETAVMNYKLKDGGRIAGGGSSPDYPPMA